MIKKRPAGRGKNPRPGDIIKITRGELKGLRAMVKNVYDEDVVSCAIQHDHVNDYVRATYQRAPDGLFYTMAAPEEYHILERVKGVY